MTTMHEQYKDGSNHQACPTCGFCKTCKDCTCGQVEMSERLQDKIALHLHMEQEAMFGRRSEDRSAIRALYNDGELLDWLDKMDKAGRIKNTGYINAKITGEFGRGR